MSEIAIAFCKATAQVFSMLSWGTNHLQKKKKKAKTDSKSRDRDNPLSTVWVLHQSKDLKNPPEKEKLTNSLESQKIILHYMFL